MLKKKKGKKKEGGGQSPEKLWQILQDVQKKLQANFLKLHKI